MLRITVLGIEPIFIFSCRAYYRSYCRFDIFDSGIIVARDINERAMPRLLKSRISFRAKG